MTANLLTLNSSKTEFLLIGLKQQLAKIHNSSLNTTHSARNLGFIFDEHLTFSDHISALSKSCYSHIRQLRCIRPYLDSKTASIIATSVVHSKLDYCNSLYYNFPKSEINRLQPIQNSLTRAVINAPKFTHTSPILKFLRWLKINERIEYKILSLTFKLFYTMQLPYLYDASPYFWNQLPHSLRQPRLDLPLPDSSLLHDHLTSRVSSSPLLSSFFCLMSLISPITVCFLIFFLLL